MSMEHTRREGVCPVSAGSAHNADERRHIMAEEYICWDLEDFVAITNGARGQLRVRDFRDHAQQHPECPARVRLPDHEDEVADAYLSIRPYDWQFDEIDDRFRGHYGSWAEFAAEEVESRTPIGMDPVTVDSSDYTCVRPDGLTGLFVFFTGDLTVLYGPDYHPVR